MFKLNLYVFTESRATNRHLLEGLATNGCREIPQAGGFPGGPAARHGGGTGAAGDPICRDPLPY